MAAKRAAIMVDQMYQVLEVWFPYYRLKEAGVGVDFVAAEAKREYPSKEGYPCVSDVAAKDAHAEDYDCMIVPGGFAPDFMRPDGCCAARTSTRERKRHALWP